MWKIVVSAFCFSLLGGPLASALQLQGEGFANLAPASLTENKEPARAIDWQWQPPFDGPAPVGYSPTLWWVGFAIAILVPALLLRYAFTADPPVPTKAPSWLPKGFFEESWNDRQCYVLWITCVQWFILAFASQLDFNPAWSVYVSKHMGLNPAEIGWVLSTGPLASSFGLVIGLVALRYTTVGWLMLYTLPYVMVMNPMYGAFRTPTLMAATHFLMALFWCVEYICALNRLSRIVDRANLPKCMGFALTAYIAGMFAGTTVMPMLLAIDYNIPFIVGNLSQAFLSYNAWLNFRNEEGGLEVANDNEKEKLKSLGLYQETTNIKMLAVVSIMYFCKSGAVAITNPTFFPYLDGVIGPLSPLAISSIKGVEILVQAVMHVVIGAKLNGTSQTTLVMALCWGFLILGVGHLFYEPSAKLFLLFPSLRADAQGHVLPAAIWVCGVVIAQFLVSLGNTIIGIVILPITQSFFATDNAFLVESISPAIYNVASTQGIFAGNYLGGMLTMAYSFGGANEVIALSILLIGLVAPLAFHMGHIHQSITSVRKAT